MDKCIEEYKEISKEILEMLSKENYENLESKLEERQVIINKVKLNNRDEFKNKYVKEDILNIDNEIKLKIEKMLESVKEEIKEHKRKQKASSMYIKNTKNNINLFYKKV